jgi:hypothetical protein
VDASIRQFCATANALLQGCADFDAKRQFLVDHVERLIYNRYTVTIAGSVPVQSASGESKLQFRIEGKIDIGAIRSAASRKVALESMQSLASVSDTSSVGGSSPKISSSQPLFHMTRRPRGQTEITSHELSGASPPSQSSLGNDAAWRDHANAGPVRRDT